MHFYIYKVEDLTTGEFYFGSRKCQCFPEEDVNYKGSMSKWKPDKEKLFKTLIKTDFTNHQDLIDYETLIIKQYIHDPLNRNYAIPNYPFHITRSEDVIGENNGFFGKHHTEEHKLKVSEKLKGEKNPSFGKNG